MKVRGLVFRDIRRFGSIALTPTDESAFPVGVQNLGPEPWQCDAEEFASLFKARRASIKSLLLNQTLISGLGNIYSDESLYRAGIRPVERACRIARRRLEHLHEVLCKVLEEAIEWGGSSIDDYLHADGTRGRFQEFHRVYGRGGEECRACGERIRTVKLAGRTSSFCPECQK
jgi:formamidopyrimidine-DNA glycosylase